MLDIQELQNWEKVTPERFNALVKRINVISKITGRGGISVDVGPQGIAIFGSKKTVRSAVRRAITTEAAGAFPYIQANLYDESGGEITEGEESDITVYASIMGDVNLDSCIPRLVENKDIFVIELPYDAETNRWYLIADRQASQDCEDIDIFTHTLQIGPVGSDPDDNGNVQFTVVGNKMIVNARSGDAWVDTGFFITVA